MTASSRLKQRLFLQQEVLMPDSVGGYTKTWETLADIWAEIKPFGGAENILSGGLQASVTHRVQMRYRSGVTPAMRLVFDERIFNIRTIHNIDEKNDMLELLVEEGVGN